MSAVQQIKEVFAQATRSFSHNKVSLFKALVPIGVLFFVFSILEEMSGGWGHFIFAIINLFVIAHIMIVIHKITLLGADSVPDWGIWLWGKKELKFCLHIFISFVAIGLILTFFGLFLVFLPILNYIIVAYLIARFYLIIPSTAIGDKMPLEESWKTTQGQGMMMFVVVSLLPFVTSVLEGGLKDAILGEQSHSIVASVLPTLIFAPVLVFQVVLLSEAYRFCIQFRPQKLEDITQEQLSNLTGRRDILPKD